MNRFYPAGPLGRVAFKAPLTLWRMGLGRLLGGVMVVITHTGRKSGLPRRTMTEYQRDGETIYVPVAFGDRAQWYQNIAADPRVTLQTDRGARSMLAHRVTGDEELGRVYDLIKARNPLMFSAYLKSIAAAGGFDLAVARPAGGACDPDPCLQRGISRYVFPVNPFSCAHRPRPADAGGAGLRQPRLQ
jgi:deazaflavin-dependent oxidoreductase (nitroreductase family)